jgi:cupin fold WbuC family metalloprotein
MASTAMNRFQPNTWVEVSKEFLEGLLKQAVDNPRKRVNYDMRTSPEDGSQRMLNAMQPGTEVAIHRHPNSNENVILITGKMYEILYEEVDGRLVETERLYLCPTEGKYGCQVPKGVWHTVEVIEPSVIYEAKDGKYGEDGSENFLPTFAIDK